MAIQQVFKCSLESSKYIFKNGKEAHFIGGEYVTGDAEEISQLDHECSLTHPHIRRDKDKLTVDTAQLNPLEEIKRLAIEEYLAKQAAATDSSNDRGKTATAATLKGILTSREIKQVTAESTSAAQ